MAMSWDRSARPKRLRRKQKRVVLLVAIVASIAMVVAADVWNDFATHKSGSIFDSLGTLTDAEKRKIWQGMSDENKSLMQKEIPTSP